jgi:polyketide synthase 3/4
LVNITDQLIDRDWGPKVLGAWNLHLATAGEPLDWFCSFSSAAALVGSPGQGAYAAANSWVDGFTHWRRSQGLPATAIAWGAWSEIGAGQSLAEQSDSAIAPDEGAFAFESLLRYDRAYSAYTPVIGLPWLTAFAQRSRFAEEFQSIGQGGRGEGSKFLAELSTLPQEEWPSKLRHMVADQIGLILRRSVDPDRPLAEYGLDSLGNLEVRTRIETETGVRITPADISTVRNLAAHICDKLVAQVDAPAAT